MRVRITRSAERDLDEIAAWIAAENPSRAASFVRELREKCLNLGSQPKRYPLVRNLGGYEIRKRTHAHYLILFFVMADHVEVAHVVHGSRDWMSLLGSNE
ncbi:MAG: toxin ParE1/3/4 [Sphingomonadales bacterium]|nr:toxin ParE1/3/4 [Sphingomonadales bacterium]